MPWPACSDWLLAYAAAVLYSDRRMLSCSLLLWPSSDCNCPRFLARTLARLASRVASTATAAAASGRHSSSYWMPLVEATGLLLLPLPLALPQYPSSLGAAAAAEAETGDDTVMVPLAAANANSDVCLSARWCCWCCRFELPAIARLPCCPVAPMLSSCSGSRILFEREETRMEQRQDATSKVSSQVEHVQAMLACNAVAYET